MIQIIDKRICCGCSACEQTCPKHAISMQPDKKGFSYPVVNIENCVDCGLCEQACPILHEKDQRVPSHVYAVKNKDEEVRMKSSSGGFFSILTEDVIKMGGVVYGAAFDDDWHVRHVRVDDKQSISKLRGSKYVQSQIGDTYKQVRKDLKEGRRVLFSGTPCQVAGLKRFLGRGYANLLTVDLVCHGVPNPRIWKEYLKEQQKAILRRPVEDSPVMASSKINWISFRDKSKGWIKFRFALQYTENSSNGDKRTVFSSTDIWEHPYMLLFLKNYILRPSCHNCKFRCGRSGADYTLADYWGIERFYPDFFDDRGVSLVLQYSNEKMEEWLKDKVFFIETSFEEACSGNAAILRDLPINPDSKLFYFFYDTLGISVEKSQRMVMKVAAFRHWYQNKKAVAKNRIYQFVSHLNHKHDN